MNPDEETFETVNPEPLLQNPEEHLDLGEDLDLEEYLENISSEEDCAHDVEELNVQVENDFEVQGESEEELDNDSEAAEEALNKSMLEIIATAPAPLLSEGIGTALLYGMNDYTWKVLSLLKAPPILYNTLWFLNRKYGHVEPEVALRLVDYFSGAGRFYERASAKGWHRTSSTRSTVR